MPLVNDFLQNILQKAREQQLQREQLGRQGPLIEATAALEKQCIINLMNYIISERLLQKVLNYLARQPYINVAEFVKELQNLDKEVKPKQTQEKQKS